MENLISQPLRRPVNALNDLARHVVLQQLTHMATSPSARGRLEIHEGAHSWVLGYNDDAPPARLHVHDPSVWRDLLTGGSIGAAEAYVAGDWSSPDLPALLRFFVRSVDALNQFEDRFSWVSKPTLKALHWLNRNTLEGSRKNIQAHYDLGNALFEQFLDPTMMYSSAIFPSPESSLEEASVHKLDLICRKLDLQPHDHLLEIGTGWGGLALHAARQYGCQVTTTTLSREQFHYAQRRIAEAGLQDCIHLRLDDYRQLDGQYTKLVSVEMIEAVGPQFLETYFHKLSSLLTHDGLALIQAITLPEQRYARALRNVDFIQRYIFPGSFIPSLGAITDAVRQATDMTQIHQEDFGFHYARTLRAWRERFHKQSAQISLLGYDAAFQRLWDFYFAYCEAGFEERAVGVSHLLFAKPANRRDRL